MNYFRRFFTLTTGSQSSRRDATGRVVLEARNDVVKTTVFLQDVQEGAYRLVAFSKEGLAADIGAVIINEKGRFDGKFELNRKSVAGSGLAAEDVEGMTIITPPNGTDFSVVLSGFLSEPFPLRANLHFDQPKIAASEIIEDDAEDEVAEMVEEIINEVVLDEIMEEITEDAPETSIEIAEETSEDYVEEIEDVEDNETVEEVELEVQEQAPAPTYPFSDFEHSHKMPPSQNERIDRFFGGRNAVDVFKNHEPKTDWVAASLVDVQ
ncbi:MAG: hypothetical protein FWE44_07740, partial [Defluviitaleaceae bacterium]|nr:hypothetical protein [Defluviitaleaceae bacterium]